MKLCIHLRDSAPRALRQGNLRSEPRWERQALEAALMSPLVTAVYTSGCPWNAKHPKYKGMVNSSAASNSILIMQDYNYSVINRFNYKGVIVNIFSGPWAHQKDEVKRVAAKYGDRFVLTIGFPVLYRDSGLEHLKQFVDERNVVSLPVPGIPVPAYRDCFQNKTILWAWRMIFFSQAVESPGVSWALKKLQEDETLNLFILTGWNKGEEKDYINEQLAPITTDLETYFWNQEAVSPYLDVRSRVKIEYSLNWEQVIDLYSRAKILAVHAVFFGGPPLEAAMHGVPFVGLRSPDHGYRITGALADADGYLSTADSKEAYELLDRLMVDKDFYEQTALSYHNYAINNFTYESFCNNIYEIAKTKGML